MPFIGTFSATSNATFDATLSSRMMAAGSHSTLLQVCKHPVKLCFYFLSVFSKIFQVLKFKIFLTRLTD